MGEKQAEVYQHVHPHLNMRATQRKMSLRSGLEFWFI